MSLDFPFGNKILHASGMSLGVPYMLQIQAYDKGALDGRKERRGFPSSCNACHIFVNFSSQLLCLELLALTDSL